MFRDDPFGGMLQKAFSEIILARWFLLLFVLAFHTNSVTAGPPSHAEAVWKLSTRAGFKPRTIVDVGANRGVWSTKARGLWPDARILMLEASDQHNETLHNVASKLKNAQYQIGVLSEKDGEEVDFFDGGDTGNSMFKEDTRFYVNDKPIKRVTHTLDTVVSSFLKNATVDLLKIDVQGAEEIVLKGASNILSQVTFVQFEASLIQYNIGGACFWHVDSILQEHGFALYDLGDLMYNARLFKTFGVGQMDVIYARYDSPNLPEKLKNLKPNYCMRPPRQVTPSLDLFPEPEVLDFSHLSTVQSFASGIVVGATAAVLLLNLLRKRK